MIINKLFNGEKSVFLHLLLTRISHRIKLSASALGARQRASILKPKSFLPASLIPLSDWLYLNFVAFR